MPKNQKGNIRLLITDNNFSQRIEEYHHMNTQKKAIENNMDILKSSLKSYVQSNGTRNSDSGTLMIETDKLTVENRAVKKITPSLTKLINSFADRPEIISEIVKVQTYLDEEALGKLLERGVVTTKEVESICDITTNYSFYVTPKEELPEVQKTSVTTAAAQRRKPLLKSKAASNVYSVLTLQKANKI